nr:hypothetical protein [Roseovarius pacificus]
MFSALAHRAPSPLAWKLATAHKVADRTRQHSHAAFACVIDFMVGRTFLRSFSRNPEDTPFGRGAVNQRFIAFGASARYILGGSLGNEIRT